MKRDYLLDYQELKWAGERMAFDATEEEETKP